MGNVVNVARRTAAVAAIAFMATQPMLAQASPPARPTDAGQCFGFAFGSWTPTLDWQRAGHGSPLDSARVPRAPGGRGWAALDVESQSDSTLLLFPPWWPAGVVIDVGAKPISATDTVPGQATALVADGRLRPPRSTVRVWRVSCS
jgi:hypothetical protein